MSFAAALRYVEFMLPVIPLCAPLGNRCSCPWEHDEGSIGKRSRLKGWQERPFRTEGDLVNEWPSARVNIGLPTGPTSGVMVLDVDPRNGGSESYRELKAKGLPETWVAKTGGDGIHVFFRHDPAIPKGVTGLLPGIDIKDAGGYVVAAPSVHRSGSSYRWVVSPIDHDLAEQPAWLKEMRLELARKRPCVLPFIPRTPRPDGANILDRARRYAAHLDPAVSGQGGHNATLRAAGQVAVGFDLGDDEAMAVLAEWNARCSPPWSERDLLRKIHEARKTSQRAPGFLLAA